MNKNPLWLKILSLNRFRCSGVSLKLWQLWFDCFLSGKLSRHCARPSTLGSESSTDMTAMQSGKHERLVPYPLQQPDDSAVSLVDDGAGATSSTYKSPPQLPWFRLGAILIAVGNHQLHGTLKTNFHFLGRAEVEFHRFGTVVSYFHMNGYVIYLSRFGIVRDNLAVYNWRFKDSGFIETFHGHVKDYKYLKLKVVGRGALGGRATAVTDFGTHGLVRGLLQKYVLRISFRISPLARPARTATNGLVACGLDLNMSLIYKSYKLILSFPHRMRHRAVLTLSLNLKEMLLTLIKRWRGIETKETHQHFTPPRNIGQKMWSKYSQQ